MSQRPEDEQTQEFPGWRPPPGFYDEPWREVDLLRISAQDAGAHGPGHRTRLRALERLEGPDDDTPPPEPADPRWKYLWWAIGAAIPVLLGFSVWEYLAG